MGVDVNGKIGYGLIETDLARLPWFGDRYKGDLDSWWRDEIGVPDARDIPYSREPGSPYVQWKATRDAALQRNPCPVEEYSVGNYEDSYEKVLLIPGTYQYSSDWSASYLDTEKLKVSKSKILAFEEFLEKYGIQSDRKPGWILFSTYG